MTPTRFRLDGRTVEHLAIDSAVLGTGGGGDSYIGKLITQRAIEEYGSVDVISADALNDDDLVIVVSMSGAPSVMIERLASGRELEAVYQRAIEHAGHGPPAVIAIEIQR